MSPNGGLYGDVDDYREEATQRHTGGLINLGAS